MAERIKLPFITGVRIVGFQPIFSEDISLDTSDGPYVILGGNGLGKTTFMQAVIYGLAGGLDEKIEDTKSFRWSNSYFSGRLTSSQIASAQVEVDFRLGKHAISVRRGFRASNVTAVRDGRGAWIEEDSSNAFGALLREYGGYLDPTDFAFLVHRLLYLPESRRLIAWDADAQIRLFMLLNQDIVVEREFREQRAQLKLLDSKKRHFRVAINNADAELARLLEYDREAEDSSEEPEDTAEQTEDDATRQSLPRLVSELQDAGRQRADAERRAKNVFGELSQLSGRIDTLRFQIETAEAGLVASFLEETEREQNLALAKLVEHSICPACGQRQSDLANLARQYVLQHKCALCGSDQSQERNPELTQLQAELEELLGQQQAFEELIRLAREEIKGFRDQEINLQSQVNEIRFRQPVVAMIERNLPEMTADSLRNLKRQLEDNEADAAAQIESIRDMLSGQYEDFRRKMDVRMELLRASYVRYTTAFLGLACGLNEVGQGGLLDLKLFVPRFDNVVRRQGDSCSEAQRFFLDIAFRLALIDAACGERGAATFFCETPENALDMSYIRNVVTMFMNFARRRHNILLTANVQTAGIAERILERLPKRNRENHIMNLLKYGRLSTVQRAAIGELNATLKRISNAKMVRS